MRNITIKEYMKSANAIDYSPLQFLEPYKSFGSHEAKITDLTYEEVKSVVRTLKKLRTWNDVADVFETVFKIDREQFFNGRILDFFSARNYIVKEFKRIVKTENRLLQSITKDYGKWVAAGGEKLNRFSDVIPLNQLGKIYGVYPFDLKDYKYTEILTLLVIEKEQGEVDRKMNEM